MSPAGAAAGAWLADPTVVSGERVAPSAQLNTADGGGLVARLSSIAAASSGVALAVVASLGVILVCLAGRLGSETNLVIAALAGIGLVVSGAIISLRAQASGLRSEWLAACGLVLLGFGCCGGALFASSVAVGAARTPVVLMPLAVLAGSLFVLDALRASPLRPSSAAGRSRILFATAGVVVVCVTCARLDPAWSLAVSGAVHSFGGFAALGMAAVVLLLAARLTTVSATRLLGAATPQLRTGLLLLAVSTLGTLGPVSGQTGVSPVVVLELVASILVVTAVARHEQHCRVLLARRAALAERQRLARELHDGLAQDLAVMAAHGELLGERGGAVALAARRALSSTRGLIEGLSDLDRIGGPDAFGAVAHELESRFAVAVETEIDEGLCVPADRLRDLLRVMREAVSNAVRHGSATRVVVSLSSHGDHTVFRIHDNGRGRGGGPDAAALDGFGLASMRDRAATMGGQLAVHAPGDGGLEIAVTLPKLSAI